MSKLITVLIVVCYANCWDFVEARETKSQKLKHAKNLQALIFSIDQKILKPAQSLSKPYKDQLKSGFKLVAVKLVNKKQVEQVLKSIEKFQDSNDLRKFRQYLEDKFHLRLSPSRTLDKMRGRKLYLDHCSGCHGDTGDGNGLLVERISAKPLSFSSRSFRERISPHMVFNYSLYGLPSGIMKPMGEILDYYDLWCLSFYVSGMGYENVKQEPVKQKVVMEELSSKDIIQLRSEGVVKSVGQESYLRTNLPYDKLLKRR